MSSVPMPPREGQPYRSKWTAHRRRMSRLLFRFVTLLFLFAFLSGGALSAWLVWRSWPNPAMAEFHAPAWQWIDVGTGDSLPGTPLLSDTKQLWIEAELARVHLGLNVFTEEDRAIITTENRVIDLIAGSNQAVHNGEMIELHTQALYEHGKVYLPADLVSALSGVEFVVDEEHARVYLLKPETTYMAGTLRLQRYPHGTLADLLQRSARRAVTTLSSQPNSGVVEVRQQPSVKAPIVAHAEVDEPVWVLRESTSGWWQIRTKAGQAGYVPQTAVRLEGMKPFKLFAETMQSIRKVEETVLPPETDWQKRGPGQPLSGKRLVVVWEQVERATPNPETIGELAGVDVLAPTWFALEDGDGYFLNKADSRYVAWAHERNIKVWGTATNSFDPDLTKQALSSRENRLTMIQQLLHYASLYQLDGINLDFENVYYEDRDRLTQFVRELAPLAHAQGLTLSIDVTMISTSPNWSMVYDRKALAEVVDYVALMAYDEHWAASPVAGSVASLPWVERGLRAVLAEVPKEKLLLGLPLYTRVWREGSDGVRSTAVTMARGIELAKEHNAEIVWDEASQQNYFEYTGSDGVKRRVWIEDEVSMDARLQLVQKYDLAGVAAWRRGYETDTLWPQVQAAMSLWP